MLLEYKLELMQTSFENAPKLTWLEDWGSPACAALLVDDVVDNWKQ